MNKDEWFNGKWTPAPEVICPHCHQPGDVSLRLEDRKRGISGGKVVAAIFTFGISLLVVGLSQRIEVQRATCDHCGVSWDL